MELEELELVVSEDDEVVSELLEELLLEDEVVCELVVEDVVVIEELEVVVSAAGV